MYFRYFVIIYPWKRVGPFIWRNLRVLITQECFVPSLVEIGQLVLEKKTFFNFINVYLLFRNYVPLEKGGALHLNKFDSSSPKDALCQVLLNLALWFWRRFLNFVNVFLLFRNYLPLEKGGVLHLNKLESPSPKDTLCQVWLKLAQWFLRRSRK